MGAKGGKDGKQGKNGKQGNDANDGREEREYGDKIRFAVVGQGYFSQAAILPAFESRKVRKRCELTAIFSDDETKLRALKRKYDVEHALSYDQYDEFLASGAVDAVYIALPNDMHCDYTVRAARAGVHVLCEKPMAVTSDEAERMIAACAENDVRLMIAYRLHFEEANMDVVDLLHEGKGKKSIGEPRFFSSVFSQQVSKGNSRTKSARGGGPLYDIGIYCINAARYLFRAEPIEVLAAAATKKGDERFREIEEQVSATLRFPDERLAQFTCSFGAYDQSTYTVVGTEGQVRLTPAYDFAAEIACEIERRGKSKRKTYKARDQVAPQLLEMVDCIRKGRDPEPSGREGLADLRVIEAIQQAVRRGAVVPVQAVQRGRRPSGRQVRKVRAHGMPDLVDAQTPGQS